MNTVSRECDEPVCHNKAGWVLEVYCEGTRKSSQVLCEICVSDELAGKLLAQGDDEIQIAPLGYVEIVQENA